MNVSETTAGFFDYSPAACLRVTGDDALSFLQGQFTQELRPDRAPPVTYGLWLNQKGRVLADSFTLRVGEREVWLVSLGSAATVLRERLESYVIADDVVIEDVTDRWKGRVLFGGEAGAWLRERLGGALPAVGEWVRVAEGFVFRGRRGVEESWEWLSPEPLAVPATGTTALSEEKVEHLRIAAGIPSVPKDIGPDDLPNEAGLEVDAVSYTKGCYLGQEVMARLKSMGRVRRRLLRVSTTDNTTPSLPAALFQEDRKVGDLRSLAPRPGGGAVGLALCSLLALDPARPLALNPQGEGTFTLIDRL